MSGSMCLYVSEDKGVLRVPRPKNNSERLWQYKAVKKMANEKVLIITLGYELLNHRPYKLHFVSFRRAVLDERGVYIITRETMKNDVYNYIHYEGYTADELSKMEGIPLPQAPDNIPTSAEKKALYLYLGHKYPELSDECSYLVEKTSQRIKNNYFELRELVKEAYRRRLRRN